jgi:aminomethyltransferase
VAETPALSKTPLHSLHVELGARLVPFAGYEMPVQYPAGILAEHRHTRMAAGLFDVSHMGQVRLVGADADAALETLVPGDVRGLDIGAVRYTLFTNDAGGIIDDLMVTRRDGDLFLVVNASNKAEDVAHLRARLPASVTVEPLVERALLALQGPAAAAVMARLAPEALGLSFMRAGAFDLGGHACWVSRSGYTGEDGFEISVDGREAEALARRLLAEPEVAPVCLGARDSLRLEAGLCLHGHDIDPTTNPIEASLAWTIPARRRAEGGFPGAATILKALAEGPARRRVGIQPEGRAPAREGTAILDAEGREVGTVTSGGFAPSLDRPVAMGYVPAALAKPGTPLGLSVRGKVLGAATTRLPFHPHNYAKP